MTGHTVYLYVLDTMADWEPGLAIAELNSGRYFKHRGSALTVKTVALNRDPVTSMGGVRILPDATLDEIHADETALLILPGADTWHEERHAPVPALVEALLAVGVPVAAICGATVALAQAGTLNRRRHTSNDLTYLKQICPGYTGEDLYQHELAVTDADLITASGIAPLDFAYQIINRLDLFSQATLDAWYRLFSTHEPEYFFALMQSLSE